MTMMSQASGRFFLVLLAMMMLVATIHGQGQRGGPGRSQGGSPAGGRGGLGFGVLPAPTPPKPLFPNAKLVRSCESMAEISLPNTTIESAAVDPNSLEKIKDMPVIFVHGDKDEAVPVSLSQRWAEKAKELNMTYEFNEMPGISHGPVITASLPSVYAFFAKHSKPATH
jgi:pimeloyl-ACP methyl ester carboxylesterase